MIPYFHNSREYKFIEKEYRHLSSKVFKSGIFLQGNFTNLLEDKIAKKLNVKYCITCNSCTDATYFIIKSLNHSAKKMKIMTSNFSFIASGTPILRASKEAILSGCNDEFLINQNISKFRIKDLHSIILVGLFGKLLDEKFINKLKKVHKVPIIEDLAQNFGAKRKNKKFLIGDAGSISFDPTKILSAPGSGGCVITNSQLISKNVRSLRYHGKNGNKFDKIGYNSQMSELTACYLISKLDKLDKWNKRRIKISKYYLDFLKKKEYITTQSEENNIYHKFVIHTKYKSKLEKLFIQKKIQYRHHYPNFLSDHSIFKNSKVIYKNDNNFVNYLISIPNHNFLSDGEVELIANQLKKL